MEYKRNEQGLIEGFDYVYNDDGSINWRKMIKDEHLYVNKGYFERFNKPVPSSVEGLEDSQLLIKLSGIKELAKMRGFSSVRYFPIVAEEDRCVTKCQIVWIPNFESERCIFEDIASATLFNTDDFGAKFLDSIAANRSFVRCVRNFLNIHIVGVDEIDKSNKKVEKSEKQNDYGPVSVLMKNMELGEEDFDLFKSNVETAFKKGSYKNQEFQNWQKWEDIPSTEAVKLVKIFKIS